MPYSNEDAQRAAKRKSYLNNKEAIKAKDRVRKEAARAKINALKDSPCTDCKIKYPYYVMQFDHVRGEKLGDISKFFSNRQYQKMFDEIEKCELVCANCHAARSWNRIQ